MISIISLFGASDSALMLTLCALQMLVLLLLLLLLLYKGHTLYLAEYSNRLEEHSVRAHVLDSGQSGQSNCGLRR